MLRKIVRLQKVKPRSALQLIESLSWPDMEISDIIQFKNMHKAVSLLKAVEVKPMTFFILLKISKSLSNFYR